MSPSLDFPSRASFRALAITVGASPVPAPRIISFLRSPREESMNPQGDMRIQPLSFPLSIYSRTYTEVSGTPSKTRLN